jgi:hypothetical protein
MAAKQTLGLSLVLLILTAVAVSVFIAVSVRADQPVAPTIPTWPAFSMLYETDGETYTRGSSPQVNTREVRRLDYQSPTQWTDTVVEAPTITTSVGSHSRVGYTAQLNGTSYVEADAAGRQLHTYTVDEDTTFLVGTMPPPFPIVASGVTTTTKATTAKVCFQTECTENAGGVLYTKSNGSEFVYVDDARGIPLQVNDSFIVKEITINDTKQAITR